MGGEKEISYFAAFLAGFLSFVSPCILPLIPSYITYITGVSLDDRKDSQGIAGYVKIIFHSIAFVLGFSAVFTIIFLGLGAIGETLFANVPFVRILGGIFIIFLGFAFMEIIRIPFLYQEKKFNLKNKPAGIIGSFIVGVVFAAGWTPCVGPILVGVLGLAATKETIKEGIFILSFYCLGLGLPFIISSLVINSFFTYFEAIKKHLNTVKIISGGLLVIIGGFIAFPEIYFLIK